MTARRSRRIWGISATTLILTGVLAGTAWAANPSSNTTTTGQDLTVEISLDPGGTTALWSGTAASVDATATISNNDAANLVYVLDVSGSMEDGVLNPFQDIVAPAGIGPEDDCNGDGISGSALDAACFGLISLNQSLGSSDQIDIGLVAFGDGAKTADMSPAAGSQFFASPPDIDGDATGGDDAGQVIRSTDTENFGSFTAGIGLFTSNIDAGFGTATNYNAALTSMNSLLALQPATEISRAVFISDGLPNSFTWGPGSPLSGVAENTVVDTFAIGAYAPGACASGQPLAIIAAGTDGTCTEVTDPSTLATVLQTQTTSIVSLELSLDGVLIGSSSGSEPVQMTITDVDLTELLTPGTNVITATATAADGTTATADVSIEVVDLQLTPSHQDHDLSIENTHTVTATLLGTDSVVSGTTLTFQVTGQNPTGPTNVVANGSGVGIYSYSVPVELESLGLDMITASATIDGVPRSRTVTARWIDATPPTAACVQTANPDGRNVPQAPGRGGQAQNPDGFYELLGDDEPFGPEGLQLFVVDDGSGTVFGPYEVGTRIKYTQANGTTPKVKAMAGNNGSGGNATAVDYHIWGNGDGMLIAVDLSGNESDGSACLVPRSPK